MYSLRYVLADEQGKQRELDWQIVVSDMNVQAVEIPRFETWADRTVFYGEVIEGHTPGAETVYSFQYRKKEKKPGVRIFRLFFLDRQSSRMC